MRDTIRVLHIQHSLEPGGMENGVVNIARALQPKGFEFHVACLARSGEFAARLPDPELVHVLNKPEGFSPRTVYRLHRLIRRIRPHVLHSHNLGALIYAACATISGRTRPILHGEHGQPGDGQDADRRNRQRQKWFKSARRVHTVSQGLRDHFVGQGFPKEKLVALVNGVDTERFSPEDRNAARAELGIELQRPVLVIVGRLIASKMHQLLFEALEGVAAEHPDALLLVVGGGGHDEAEICAAAEASSVKSMIRMEGFQSDPRRYYQAADLLVAPSRIEGLSNVVLEAMACGLPPLLHDACGSGEVIDNGIDGTIANLDTAQQLSSTINHLLAQPEELTRMGKRSREKVLAQFSLESMATGYEQMYRELARI